MSEKLCISSFADPIQSERKVPFCRLKILVVGFFLFCFFGALGLTAARIRVYWMQLGLETYSGPQGLVYYSCTHKEYIQMVRRQ